MVKTSEIQFETTDDSRIKIPLRKLIERLSSSHHITQSSKPSSIITNTNTGIVVYDRKRLSKNVNRMDEVDNKAELDDQNFEEMAGKQWITFAQGISTTVNIFYSRIATKVRDYWGDSPTDDRNFEMLDNLHLLLTAAQYEPITSEEYDMCEESNFEVKYSISPKWSQMDTQPFHRWCKERNIYDDDPFFSRHVLIYTTGMYQQTQTGLFLEDKVGYLLTHLWGEICKRAPRGWLSVPLSHEELRRRSQKEEERIKEQQDKEEGNDEKYDFGDEKDGLLRGSDTNVDLFAATTRNGLKANATQSAVFSLAQISKRVVSRYTLSQFLKDNGMWTSLTKTTSLKEMFYASVIVVTRSSRKAGGPKPWIEVKEFTNVAVADVEALLPARHVHLPPTDTISFAFQVGLILSFLVFGIKEFFDQPDTEREDKRQSRLIMVGMLLLGLVSKLYTLVNSYFKTKITYDHAIEQWLEKKREGKDEAILAKLSSNVCAQETKEILLAYFFLWKMGKMSPEDLQHRIKRFLQTEFKVENFCFDVVDAINKLQNLKLVRRCGDHASAEASPSSSPTNLEPKVSNGGFQMQTKEEYEVIVSPADWIKDNKLGKLSDITLLEDVELAARKEAARLKQSAAGTKQNVGSDKKRLAK